VRYFGGRQVPHVRVLEHYPADFLARRAGSQIGRGCSFPAAHASGGFALFAFFFILPGRWKWAGVVLGLGAGWSMGVYKMLIGDHYLSHTLITCLFAWFVCAGLAQVFAWAKRRWGERIGCVSSKA